MEKFSPAPPLDLQANDPRLNGFLSFSGLKTKELEILLKLADTVVCPSGTSIIREGEEGYCLYVLLEGIATVQAEGMELATLQAGDFFGEVSLVDEGCRSATVLADTPCNLLRLTRVTLGVLAGLEPMAAVQILSAIGKGLVARLRAGNRKYLDLLHAAPREPSIH